jgi:hypothetical protein
MVGGLSFVVNGTSGDIADGGWSLEQERQLPPERVEGLG